MIKTRNGLEQEIQVKNYFGPETFLNLNTVEPTTQKKSPLPHDRTPSSKRQIPCLKGRGRGFSYGF